MLHEQLQYFFSPPPLGGIAAIPARGSGYYGSPLQLPHRSRPELVPGAADQGYDY